MEERTGFMAVWCKSAWQNGAHHLSLKISKFLDCWHPSPTQTCHGSWWLQAVGRKFAEKWRDLRDVQSPVQEQVWCLDLDDLDVNERWLRHFLYSFKPWLCNQALKVVTPEKINKVGVNLFANLRRTLLIQVSPKDLKKSLNAMPCHMSWAFLSPSGVYWGRLAIWTNKADRKALPATNLTTQLCRRLKISSPSRMNVSPNVPRKLWLVMEPCGSLTESGPTDSAPYVEFPIQLEACETNPRKFHTVICQPAPQWQKKVLAPELRLDQWADLYWLSNWFWVTETWGCIGMGEVSSVFCPADNRENVEKNV